MNLQQFTNQQFGDIRALSIEGEPWFVGKDVALALGYTNPRKALADHVDAEDKLQNDGVTIRDPMGRDQKPTVINESGLYSLVLSSKLPSAKAFKRWITHDVIPTIRKTGGYVNDADKFVDAYFPELNEAQKSVLGIMLDESRRMGQQLKEQAPKVLFADAVTVSHTSILIGELAKLIKQNGVEIGQNRLFKWLRENGFLMRDNMPTQYAMERGLFVVTERTINNPDGSVRITRTTKVTGKGQTYFINRFLAKGA